MAQNNYKVLRTGRSLLLNRIPFYKCAFGGEKLSSFSLEYTSIVGIFNTKRKKNWIWRMFANKILPNRFLLMLAWNRVNDRLYCYSQGNKVCSPGPLGQPLSKQFLSTRNSKLIVDSQLYVWSCLIESHRKLSTVFIYYCKNRHFCITASLSANYFFL